uniref:Putative two component regulator propeller n=1 Tax=viral metagenome TaxID=1070528 RepID=A0A6M3J5I8_9ZZZZ
MREEGLRTFYERKSLYKHLSDLHSVAIKFINDGNQTLDAQLFELNSKVQAGDTTDGNEGVVFQSSINGYQLPTNTCYSLWANTDYLIVGTQLGVWIFDRATNTGTTIDTSTTVTGDALPDNVCLHVFYDEYRYNLWVGTNGGGLWRYNFVTGIGELFNASGGAGAGDQLTNNVCWGLTVDLINNVVFVATGGGVWQYNVTTDTGKSFTPSGGAGSGDQVPVTTCNGVSVDYVNTYLWVSTIGGVWRYDRVGDNGKTYNASGGAGAGSQLPNNWATKLTHVLANNTLYVGTLSGIWIYDVTLDTGSVINTSTVVIGNALPSNATVTVELDVTNGIMWVGTQSGLWKYIIATNTGKVYNTTGGAGSGDQLPNNYTSELTLDTNGIVNVCTLGGGLWLYDWGADTASLIQAIVPTDQSIPSNLVFGAVVDEILNRLYCATFNGVWFYYLSTGGGKVFTSSGGAGAGSQLPDNVCANIFLDTVNNIIYVATFGGIWIYNISTDTGSVIDTSTVVTGDSLPSDIVYSCYFDSTLGKLYVGTGAGFWIYTVATNTGKLFNTVGGVGTGDQLPNNSAVYVNKTLGLDKVWICTQGGGLWRYDETLDTGQTFNTLGGAGSGSQLPSDICWELVFSGNNLYVANYGGIWIYDTVLDSGSIINASTTVTLGSQLPSNDVNTIRYDVDNDIIFVGTQNDGVWQYEITPDRGTIYNSTGGQTAGQGVPSDNIQHIYLDSTNNNLWACTLGGGMWQYVLNNEGLIGSSFIRLETSTAEYILQTLDMNQSTIVIYHIKVEINNVAVLSHLIRYILSTPFGRIDKRTIRLSDYVDSYSAKINNVIDLHIDDGMLLDKSHLFEYPIESGEQVIMTIYYKYLYEAVVR